MEKIYLTLNDLNNNLNSVIAAAKSLSVAFNEFFSNLKFTGLRFSELKHTEKWYFDEKLNLFCPTLKGGMVRSNMQDIITPFLLDNIANDSHPFTHITNATACYWMFTFMPLKRIYHESKVISTHLFRHYVAKKMLNDGYSEEQIKYFFGEKDIGNMCNYIYSDLWSWG